MKTYVNGMRNPQVVKDRLDGMTFKEISKKHKMNNPTQARAYYQNTLAFLVHNSSEVRASVRNVTEIILR